MSMGRTRRLAIVALGAGLLISACATRPEAERQGVAVVRVEVGTAGVTAMKVEVQPGGAVHDLAYSAVDGSFYGSIVLPVGTYTLTIRAYAGAELVGVGTAVASVEFNQSTAVSVNVVDTTGGPPVPDHSPILTALVASPVNPVVGQVVTLSATAVDPDGDPIAYAWSQSCASGVFAGTAAASTTWQGSSVGACVLTVTATANGKSASASVAVSVYDVLKGTLAISGVYLQHPTITSVEVSGLNSGFTCAVARSADDATCAGALPLRETATVVVRYAVTPGPGGAYVTLGDDCGGSALPIHDDGTSALFHWRAPASSSVCVLSPAIAHLGLADALPVAAFVSDACADDRLEENDGWTTAAHLGTIWLPPPPPDPSFPPVTYRIPGLAALDRDAYRFSTSGMPISIQAAGTEDLYVGILGITYDGYPEQVAYGTNWANTYGAPWNYYWEYVVVVDRANSDVCPPAAYDLVFYP